MADDVDDSSVLRVVRITEAQLQQTARCSQLQHTARCSQLQQTTRCVNEGPSPGTSVLSGDVGSGDEQVLKPPRRPAMAIYQPGVSRLARKKADSVSSGADSSLQTCETKRQGRERVCEELLRAAVVTAPEASTCTGVREEVSEEGRALSGRGPLEKHCRDMVIRDGKDNRANHNCITRLSTENTSGTSNPTSATRQVRNQKNRLAGEKSVSRTSQRTQEKFSSKQCSISESTDNGCSHSSVHTGNSVAKKRETGSHSRSSQKEHFSQSGGMESLRISTCKSEKHFEDKPVLCAEKQPTSVAKSTGGAKRETQGVHSKDPQLDDPGPQRVIVQENSREQHETRHQPSVESHQSAQSRGIIRLPSDISVHSQPTEKHIARTRLGEEKKRLFDPHNSNPGYNMAVVRQQSNIRLHSSHSEMCPDDAFSRSASHVNNDFLERPSRTSGDVPLQDVHHVPDMAETEGQQWQQVLQQAEGLAAELRLQLAHGLTGDQHVMGTVRLQAQIQKCYEGLILQYPEFANKHNIDQALWKNAFYNIIEAFRGQLSGHQMEKNNHNILALIDKGATFYNDLLQKLQRKHRFNLDAYTCHVRAEIPSRNVKLALLIAQRILICLGDIARYREQATGSSNFGKARSIYLKAQCLYPNNGHPYNQLAILAIYTRRKMDAVYFYMRSLAASNPFVTARESLMTLFEEVRRKVTQMERKKKATQGNPQNKASAKRPKARRQCDEKSSPLRREVWILPVLLRKGQKKIVDSVMGVQPNTRPPPELMKSFELNFLHTHGKLFTKTGMETFSTIVSQTLHEFQSLLQHSPSSNGNMKLLQVMGINMFAVSNSACSEMVTEASRSPLQECAVRLGLDMFGLMVTRAAHILQQLRSAGASSAGGHSGQVDSLHTELHELLPSLKVWADWMTCHQHMWNPPPNIHNSSLVVDTWTALADLCNELEDSDLGIVRLEEENREGLEPVMLEEDFHLAGFQPLRSQIISGVKYASSSSVQKGIAQDVLRKKSLQLFGQYLCGIERPVLVWEHGKHVSIVSSNHNTEVTAEQLSWEADKQDEEDVITEAYFYSEEDEMVQDSCDLSRDSFEELKAKRDLLAKLVEQKKKRKNQIEAVLDDHTSAVEMEVEVVPTFLIPDTNSFIDNLQGLQRLISCKIFTVVVPLVVINELDGLARGNRPGGDRTSAHAHRLQQGALLAVEFLEEQFSHHDSHLRALTSKGTSLDTIAFRNEDMPGHQGNNDDLILSCCLHYCHDRAEEYMPAKKGDPIRLKRDVVLLTDDRNLHLKAHTHNVPVKEIQAFIHWSGL